MEFLYKNGTPVKDGDLCFYTEFDGKNWGYNYANGLHEIFEHQGKLWSRCILFTKDNGNTFNTIDDIPLELKYATRFSKESELMHHYKIEEKYRDNAGMFHEFFTTLNRGKFMKIFNSLNK